MILFPPSMSTKNQISNTSRPMKKSYITFLLLLFPIYQELAAQVFDRNAFSNTEVSGSWMKQVDTSGILSTRIASLQSTSAGVFVTGWEGVYKINTNGIHEDISPRGGSNWTYGLSITHNDTLFVPARYISRGLGTDSVKLFVSGDNGVSWVTMQGPTFSGSSIILNSDLRLYKDTLYLMGDDELFYSADYGLNWTDISPRNTGCDQVNDIFHHNGKLYLTGCTNGGVFKWNRNSGSWLVDNSFPFTNSNRFMMRDSVIFLASPNLIQRKFPSSASWQQATSGLSSFHVYDYYNLNQNLFICSSAGVYFTENLGNTWSDFNSGWSNPSNMYPVDMTVFGDTIFIGTGTMGIYKQAIPPNTISAQEQYIPAQSLQVYPNPATDFVTIITQKGGNGTYTILDQAGKLVLEGEFKDEAAIDLKNLNSGLYVVRIKQAGDTGEQKLVIN